MLHMSRVVSQVQRSLRSCPPSTAVFVWGDGTISMAPPGRADHEHQLGPDIPDPVAKFVAGGFEWSEKEIEARINAGLTRADRRQPAHH